MSIAVLHECVVCERETLGRTGVIPENWGAFMDNTLICPECMERWRKRYNEEPPVYNLEKKDIHDW